MNDIKNSIKKMKILGLYETAYIRFSRHLFVWLIERLYDV